MLLNSTSVLGVIGCYLQLKSIHVFKTFKNCKQNLNKNGNWDFGIQTPSLCNSTAELYRMMYKQQIVHHQFSSEINNKTDFQTVFNGSERRRKCKNSICHNSLIARYEATYGS